MFKKIFNKISERRKTKKVQEKILCVKRKSNKLREVFSYMHLNKAYDMARVVPESKIFKPEGDYIVNFEKFAESECLHIAEAIERIGKTQGVMVDVSKLKDELISDTEQEVLAYLHRRPELKEAINNFVVSVAEKETNPRYLSYWYVLERIVAATHVYSGKDPRAHSTSRAAYDLLFEEHLENLKSAYNDVPISVQEDMKALLRSAYNQDYDLVDELLGLLV